MQFSFTIGRVVALLLLSLMFSGCASYEKKPDEAAEHGKETRNKCCKQPRQHYEADAYVKQLSLAHIAYSRKNADAGSLRKTLELVKAITAQKQGKPVSQPVIIISYHMVGGKERASLVAPFSMLPVPAFADLQEVLFMLRGERYIMDDIHPALLTGVQIKKDLDITSDDPGSAKYIIEKEYNSMLLGKVPLGGLDEAQVQLHLLRFFMDNHMRDAAYLVAENAEDSLAKSENSNNLEVVRDLSTRLDAEESRLYKEMPFKISDLSSH